MPFGVVHATRLHVRPAPNALKGRCQRLYLAIHVDSVIEDVDLLIRTGPEKRLSDFLLFEAAYAELHFQRSSGRTSRSRTARRRSATIARASTASATSPCPLPNFTRRPQVQ